jgi:lysophospholipase L1-like esterase
MKASQFERIYQPNSHYYRFTVSIVILLLLSYNYANAKEPPVVNLKTLSAGVFGGSICQGQTSDAKQIWINSLKQSDINLQITTCGIGGMGFSSNTVKNVPWQIQNTDTYDVYILWCSTNDLWSGQIGEIGTTDSTTQSGGLLKSIEMIKKRNESAIIILFTSLPFFSNEDGYLITGKLSQYVSAQKEFCQTYGIQYLDQFSLSGLNINNYAAYYKNDKTHFTNEGYCLIAPLQADFLRQVLRVE